jgi:hypothetical protein
MRWSTIQPFLFTDATRTVRAIPKTASGKGFSGRSSYQKLKKFFKWLNLETEPDELIYKEKITLFCAWEDKNTLIAKNVGFAV